MWRGERAPQLDPTPRISLNTLASFRPPGFTEAISLPESFPPGHLFTIAHSSVNT